MPFPVRRAIAMRDKQHFRTSLCSGTALDLVVPVPRPGSDLDQPLGVLGGDLALNQRADAVAKHVVADETDVSCGDVPAQDSS